MREEVTPDKNRAVALFAMAIELLVRVRLLPLAQFPSPNLCDLYDVIHMLLDGLLVLRGIKFRGDGAHYELIEAAKSEKILTESERVFIQDLRSKRNKHKYEGFSISAEFLERNEAKIFSLIARLQKKGVQSLTKTN